MNPTGIYIARGEDTLGPYTPSEAVDLVKRGDLVPNDLAARNGDTAWVSLSVLLPAEPSPAPTPERRVVARPASLSRPPSPTNEARPAISTPAPVSRPAASPAVPPDHANLPGQKFAWRRLAIPVILFFALLAGGRWWIARRPSSGLPAHSVAKVMPAFHLSLPSLSPLEQATPTAAAVTRPPAPLTTASPVTPKLAQGPVVQVNPHLRPPNPSPSSLAQVNPAPSLPAAPSSTPQKPTPSAAVVSATPQKPTPSAAVVSAATPPVVAPTAPPPEVKNATLHGTVLLGGSDGPLIKFGGVRVSAFPLAELTAFLAPKRAIVEAELARLAPQIEAADAERTTRVAAEHAAQQAVFEASAADLRSSLRFAYQQAKVAVKAAEGEYRYLLDQRAEAMAGEIYFRDLPPAAVTTETSPEGEFSLEIPSGVPFAVAATVHQTTADGPHTYYWLVKIPFKQEHRQTFSLSQHNVASAGSDESLIRTAN